MSNFPRSSIFLIGLPLSLALQGCSAGAVGVVLAILYAGGGGSGGVNLPPGQPLINAPLRIDGDRVLVTYFLQNDNGGPLDATMEWQPEEGTGKDGTGAFYPAGRVPRILTEPNKPERAEFLWDARADLRKYLGRSVARVRIRITASEGKISSDPGLSEFFWAGNEAPVVACKLLDERGGCRPSSTGGILPFDLTLSDSSDDPVQLEVEYSNVCLEGGTWRILTPLITKPETWFEASAAGKDLTFAWDSFQDVPHTESCDRVSVRFIPVDGFGEAGDPLVIEDIQVDNNEDPEVQILEIAGIQDRSFEIPIRFNVSDGEGDRVSVILQWAERSAGFPPLPDEVEDRDFLKQLLTSQDPESGFPSLRRDLNILSEAPILLKGTLDDSSDLTEDRSLRWIRETDFVREGLYFCPLRGECSRALPGMPGEETEGSPDFFLIGREIRLIQHDGDPGLTRKIVAFDPRSSQAELDSPLPGRLPPGTRYEISMNTGLADLSSSPEGVTHAFVWDSLKDLTDSGTPLKSTIRLRATAVDSQRNPRPPPESVIDVESDFLIAGQSLYTGKLAGSIAVGDVGDVSTNNLKLSDVVVAITSPTNEVRIYWRRSAGDLPLVPDRVLSAGGYPSSVAVGDLDGDGRDEIVVALKDKNSLRIFLQVGTSQDPFPDPPKDFPSGGSSPASIALGDLNGDGERDVAVANSGSNMARVYWGPLLGGSFQGFQDFATDSRAIAVMIGDVIGSDDLCPNDLVVACRGGERGSVNVFARQACGAFSRTLHSAGKSPSSIALGDFDGDGRTDVAVANQSSNSISIFRGDPAGLPLEPDLDLQAGSLPVSLAVGDINGDRKDDILVANQGSAKLGVYIQGPNGLPAQPFEEIPIGIGPTQLVLGKNTITRQVEAIVVHDRSEMADVLLQNFPGFVSLRSPLVLRTTDSGTSFSVSMGDVDGDGLRDVVVANFLGDSAAGTLSIYLQSPTGNLLKVERDLPAGPGPRSVAIGDLDGDGRNDVAVANLRANTVSLYRQDEGGALAKVEPDLEAGPPPIEVDERNDLSSIAIGDIDGDGRNDLGVANSASGTVRVFRQTGSGLEKAQDLTVGTKPGAVAIGDVDGDGRNEILAGFSNQVRIYREGEGGLRAAGPDLSITSPNFINSLSIADLDGDGLNDIALTGSNENGALYFVHDTRGDFVPSPSSLPVGQHPGCVSLGDLNGDGWTDALIASTNKELHLFVNSSGKFAASSDYKVETGANPNWTIIGDLNGDGRNDILAVLPKELLVYPAR